MSRLHGGGGRGHDRGPRPSSQPAAPPVFDPAKSHAELVDELAEQQADRMGEINSSQLRRFFGDVKDLYRRLETTAPQERGDFYKRLIEPQFRMMRSKASYAWRNGDRNQSKIPKSFHDFIANGVNKVRNVDDFLKFIQHFEAVVGFIYGKGLASRQ